MSMASPPRVNVPDGVTYGFVRSFAHGFQRDQAGNPLPLLTGTITFMPSVGEMKWANLPTPASAVYSKIVCPVFDGHLYAPGTTAEQVADGSAVEGVGLTASDQPGALPDRVQYRAAFQYKNTRVQPLTIIIDVVAGETLDLATIPPAEGTPGTITIVSTVDRDRAEAAAAAAVLSESHASDYAAETRLLRDSARGAEAGAAGFASEAGQAAISASESLEIVERLAGETADSATAAGQSATDAGTSAREAATSEENAGEAANSASGSALEAAGSASTATGAATTATGAANAAQGYAGTAGAAESQARTQAQAATSAASNAAASATQAAGSAAFLKDASNWVGSDGVTRTVIKVRANGRPYITIP